MKPYGMTRFDAYDDDANGCAVNGRATRVYAVTGHNGESRSYHSLRNGKKAAARRAAKRAARAFNRALCNSID